MTKLGKQQRRLKALKIWDPSPPDSLSKVVAKQQQRLKDLKASKRRQRLKELKKLRPRASGPGPVSGGLPGLGKRRR